MTRLFRRIHYWHLCWCIPLVLIWQPIVHSSDLDDARIAYTAGEFAEVVTLLRPLARIGNVDAAYLLGHMYERGEGVNQDLLQAEIYYQRSADGGHREAANRLATMLKSATATDSLIVTWYLADAQAGDAEAQYQLGYLYEVGNGVKRDYNNAVKWYQKASQQQHEGAQLRLGMLALLDLGSAKNLVDGITLIRESAENGSRIAEYLIKEVYDVANTELPNMTELLQPLRLLLPDDEPRALSLLEGKLSALESLAEDRHKKRLPVSRKNVPEITRLTLPSHLRLAPIFTNYIAGNNIDKQLATNLLITARSGNKEAQFSLGVLHIIGYGVNQDAQEGLVWIRQSAAQEYDLAKNYLLLWSNEFEGVLNNGSIAVSWLKQSARKFNAVSLYLLGVMFERGRGVEKNLHEALIWYGLAAATGHELAKKNHIVVESLLMQSRAVPILQNTKKSILIFNNLSQAQLVLIAIISGSFFFLVWCVVWQRRIANNSSHHPLLTAEREILRQRLSPQHLASFVPTDNKQHDQTNVLSGGLIEDKEAQFEEQLESTQKSIVSFAALGMSSAQVEHFLCEATARENNYNFMSVNATDELTTNELGFLTHSLPQELSLTPVELDDEQLHQLAMPMRHREAAEYPEDMQQIIKAELALAEVYYNVGIIHVTGDGMPVNNAEAFRWFSKSAQEGLLNADYQLAKMTLLGCGVTKNKKAGMKMLQQAAQNKCQLAIDYLTNSSAES